VIEFVCLCSGRVRIDGTDNFKTCFSQSFAQATASAE
jgi:hypothetical protein